MPRRSHPSPPTPAAIAAGVLADIRRTLRDERPATVPAWRAHRRRWSAALRPLPGATVIALGFAVLDVEPWGRLTAYELIATHRGAFAALSPVQLRRLGRGLADWVAVDTFATQVAGPAWRDGRVPTAQIRRWSRSPDRWLRRTAVVCTVALNLRARGGRGDTARTLDICARVVADRDDMVVKALSWALRSLLVWDAPAVQRFVEAGRDALAPRVRREVATKLRTGLKTPRRASPASPDRAP